MYRGCARSCTGHRALTNEACLLMQPVKREEGDGIVPAMLDTVVEEQHMLTSLNAGSLE